MTTLDELLVRHSETMRAPIGHLACLGAGDLHFAPVSDADRKTIRPTYGTLIGFFCQAHRGASGPFVYWPGRKYEE